MWSVVRWRVEPLEAARAVEDAVKDAVKDGLTSPELHFYTERSGNHGQGTGMSRLQVTEIFHSIQGESTWAGLPCAFVRLTGCPLRCRWCDTAYAFSGGESLSVEDVLARVAAFSCPLVEVTGGEPLAQAACSPLLSRLADTGATVLLETGGAIPIRGLDPRVRVILDVKCPDSGESHRNLPENLDQLKPGDEVKFVLASRRDYEWMRVLVQASRIPDFCPILLSPVWGELPPPLLAGWILEDRMRARLTIQAHKVIFGAETRGV